MSASTSTLMRRPGRVERRRSAHTRDIRRCASRTRIHTGRRTPMTYGAPATGRAFCLSCRPPPRDCASFLRVFPPEDAEPGPGCEVPFFPECVREALGADVAAPAHGPCGCCG